VSAVETRAGPTDGADGGGEGDLVTDIEVYGSLEGAFRVCVGDDFTDASGRQFLGWFPR